MNSLLRRDGIIKNNKVRSAFLIVNADDFGLSEQVNNGIIETFREGIVTSTSLLINGIAVSHALEKIRENPELDIGLHLNVFRGRPLSQPRYIIQQDGTFMEDLFVFLAKFHTRPKLAEQEIYREFDEQIRKALSLGIEITHLDTEKHIHVLPSVFNIVVALGRRYRIKNVRFPFENKAVYKGVDVSGKQWIKSFLSRIFYKADKKILEKSGLRETDYFHGISLTTRYSVENLKRFIKNLKPGTHELSCHPGYCKDKKTNIDYFREQELSVLKDPILKSFINSQKRISLVNFRALGNVYK